MTDIAFPGARVKSIYDYVDVLQVWLAEPLSPSEMSLVRAHSACVWRAKDFRIREPARWNRRYRQFLRVCQPGERVLRLFAERADVKITYLELARDVVFDDHDADVRAMLRLTARHFVQPRHRTRRATVFDDTENYRTSQLYDDNGRPKRGVNFQFYDIPAKETGEWPCLHMEAKVTGSAACRRLGIDHSKDLLGFDYDSLWKRHLVFYDVDREQTGRRLRNQANKTRCRTSRITNSGYNVDRAVGNLICRRFGFTDDYNEPFSTQRVVDQVGMKSLCLTRIGTFEKPTQFRHVSVTTDFGAHLYRSGMGE